METVKARTVGGKLINNHILGQEMENSKRNLTVADSVVSRTHLSTLNLQKRCHSPRPDWIELKAN